MIRSCSCTGGSASTREIGRKRTATASCKTCRGKPLVDGSVSTLGSMLGTAGLGLTSFINSDLSWKASKGSRSSSRRARKSVSTIFKTGRDEDSKSVDMSISESEKLGVSVLGCRFSEKSEHVPIKKRKFLFKLPSPPRRAPSPCLEETERLLKSQPTSMDCTASANDLGQIVDTVQDVDEKNLGRVHGQLDENEDFSGISILAAAACSNSFGGDDGHAEEGSGVEESFAREGPSEVSMNNESCSLSKGASKEDPSSAEISTEGTGSCISAVAAEELAACLRKNNSSINGLQHGNNMEDTSVQDHSIIHRSHWDLNTAMDAWERPFDCQYADSTNVADGVSEIVEDANCTDKIGTAESYELKREGAGNKCEAEMELPSSEIDCTFKMDMVKGTKSLNNGDGSAVVPADNAIGSSVTVNVDKSALDHCATTVASIGSIGRTIGSIGSSESLFSHQVAILDSCASYTLLPKPNHHTGASKSEGNCDAASTVITSVKNADGCAAGAGDILSSSFQVEKQEIMPPVSLAGNQICETEDLQIEDVEDAKEISGSHDGGNDSKNMVLLETVQPFKTGPHDEVPENPVLQFDEVGLSGSSPIDVELPTSDAFVGHQTDTRAPHDKVHVPMQDAAETGTLVHNDGEDPATKSSDKSTTNNSDDDLVNTYDKKPFVSHDCALVKVSEPELDYDSQYEDGEVRESIIHTWEEYDGEDVDAERIDYGSDNANNLGPEAEQIMNFRSCLSSSSSTKVIDAGTAIKGKDTRNEAVASDGELDKVTRDIEIGAAGNYMKEASQSADSQMKMPGWEQVLESRRNSSKTMITVGDCISRKNISGDFMDGLDAEDTDTRMYGSRPFRRDFHSRVEGQASRDLYFRRGIQGSSDAESFGRARYSQHAYARGQGGDRWVDSPDSRRGLRRHCSPNYHGPMSFRRQDGVTGRQIMDASSHGLRRRLARSGSPLDRDQAFILRMGFRSARELSPGRRVTLGRGRSLRYGPRVDGRGPRGIYHGPVPEDCTESSLKKRERSFSPVQRRGDPNGHQRRTKSPARSHSPNVSNPCPRRRSKSPSFRSEARMQRMRSPHTRPGFVADHMVGFRSMPRSHGSPPHNSKWVGDRKDGVVNFREQGYNQRSSVLDRRSPGRFNPPDGRFDLVDSPRNYRSMHLGRFSEVDGVGRGRPRYEGSNDDEGKGGLRYGLVHPSKRFRYNAEDGFVGARNPRYRDAADFHGRGSPKDYGRGIDSRIGDVPSRFREERGPFIHRRDEKFNVDSKSFGMREGDDDIASRRRPS